MRADVVIRSGMVIDGTGSPGQISDMAVVDGESDHEGLAARPGVVLRG
jgi:N-acyl-D-aspartate/D-glutamate deacylase